MSTFVQFASTDQVFDTAKVFASAWTNNTNQLTAAYSSSTQASFTTPSSSGEFYINVYNADPASVSTAEVQYAISYGHRYGSGSPDFNDSTGAEGYSAAKTIYSQYRNLVFGGDETRSFTFNDYTPDDIYVINVNRARFKNALRVGNINLTLGKGANTIHLTDDSVTTSGSVTLLAGVGRQFNLVSGSSGVRLGGSLTQVTNSGSYGFVYPDAGFIILNPAALDAAGSNGGIALGTTRASDTSNKNHQKLFDAIDSGSSFILDSVENISSRYYFCRVKNQDFNYTTNDSFTENDGTLKFDSMIDNPQTYITTVGLYNDSQDLVVVAKLSQPLPKNFTKEALIKVKLDY